MVAATVIAEGIIDQQSQAITGLSVVAKPGASTCNNELSDDGIRSYPRFPSRDGLLAEEPWSSSELIGLVSRANKSMELQHEELAFLRNYVEKTPPPEGRSVLLVSPRRLVEQWLLWKSLLPRVTPYYAVKCNSDPRILQTLESLGAGFDCASAGELKLVLDGLGVHPSRIIYSHPVKHVPGMILAEQRGVRLTVFDNVDELRRLAKFMPSAELLVRLTTDDSAATCPLSCKFGAAPEDWATLLSEAKRMQLRVRGVHFHVGSGCRSLGAFSAALRDARRVFDMASAFGHTDMDLLNIGGGFPGELSGSSSAVPILEKNVSFAALAAEITSALVQVFSYPRENIRIIAEPGRFFVAASCVLATQIEGRRIVDDPSEKHADSNPVISATGVVGEPLLSPSESQQIGPLDSFVLGDEGTQTRSASWSTSRETAKRGSRAIYYLNDGVYGTFNNVVFDHATVVPRVLLSSVEAVKQLQFLERGQMSQALTTCYVATKFGSEVQQMRSSNRGCELQLFDSVLFGPTCDGFDCILRDVLLPKLNVGDWLVFEQMGAYTICAGSRFNGFEAPLRVYMDSSSPSWEEKCWKDAATPQPLCAESSCWSGERMRGGIGPGIPMKKLLSDGPSEVGSGTTMETSVGAALTRMEESRRRSGRRGVTTGAHGQPLSTRPREGGGFSSPQGSRSSRATVTRQPGVRMEDIGHNGAAVVAATTVATPTDGLIFGPQPGGVGANRSRRGMGASLHETVEARHGKYFNSPRGSVAVFGCRLKRGYSLAELFSSSSPQPPVFSSRRPVESKECGGTGHNRGVKVSSTSGLVLQENVSCGIPSLTSSISPTCNGGLRRAKLSGKLDARTLATLWRSAYCSRQQRVVLTTVAESVSRHAASSHVTSVKAAA